MRTSSKPRVNATSARLRASPECPQITGSARTTITRRAGGLIGLTASSVWLLHECGWVEVDRRAAVVVAPTWTVRARGRSAGGRRWWSSAVGDPRPVERDAVEADRLDVLRSVRRAPARRTRSCRSRTLPDRTRIAGARERRGVDEDDLLAGDREQPERCPDVPRAQAARVVVAGQPATAGGELVRR